MSNNSLVVISGPSGSGKSTLISMLLADFPEFIYSVSVTTRAPREGEEHGKNYFFVSEDEFREMIRQDLLLEYEKVFDTFYYGTPRLFIEEQLEEHHVVIDADIKGGLQIMKKMPEAVSIFIDVPDYEELRRRINARGKMDKEELEARVATAESERAMKSKYNFIVVNTDLDQAYTDLIKIIETQATG